jgi:hypothetical protein
VEGAVVLHNLMARLGHRHYYVQGGDAGHVLGAALATLFPSDVLGFHTNMPIVATNILATLYTFLGKSF